MESNSGVPLERGIDPARVVRTFFDALNAGDQPRFSAVLSQNVTKRDVYGEHPTVGRENVATAVWSWRYSFPDLHVTMEHIASERDTVVVEAVFHGTHQRPFISPAGVVIAATGRRVTWPICYVFHLREGRIGDVHVYGDRLDLLLQMEAASELVQEGQRHEAVKDSP